MKNRIIVPVFSALTAFVFPFALTACGSAADDSNNTTPPAPPSDQINGATEDMTYSDFIKNHKDLAIKFFEDEIRPDVVNGKEVKSESWYIADKNNDNKIDTATMAWTYVVDGDTRKVEIANVTLSSPVKVQDIVDGKVESVETVVDRTDFFEFDARLNHNHQELASALEGVINFDSKSALFRELQSSQEAYKQYSVYLNNDNTHSTYTVTVEKGDGKEATIIGNLQDEESYGTNRRSALTLTGDNIKNVEYTLENLGPDKEDPSINPDDPVVNPVDPTVTNQQIITALNENCLSDIVLKTSPETFRGSVDKVSNGTWYINQNSDKNVTDANFLYYYDKNDTTSYVVLAKVEFANPVTAEDIKEGNIGTATYTQIYESSYFNTKVQDNRTALTKAICDKLFGEKTGAARYIIDGGSQTVSGLGSINGFTVIEIDGKNIHETTLYISDASNDTGYINNLDDSTKYKIASEKSHVVTGTKLENTQTATTKAGNVNIDFDDYELC